MYFSFLDGGKLETLFICLKNGVTQKKRKMEVLHLLVHSLNAHRSQGWVTLSSVRTPVRAAGLHSLSCCLSRHVRRAGLEVKPAPPHEMKVPRQKPNGCYHTPP